MADLSPSELLARARAGDIEALGCLLEMYRNSSRNYAQTLLGAQFNARVDPSDIVQETFLEIQRGFSGFRGQCEAEWEGWLHRILKNHVVETVRRHDHAKKRTIRAEKPIDGKKSGEVALRQLLTLKQPTPSHRAMRAEEAAILHSAVEALSSDQQDVIRLRYMEGKSLKEIAEHFDRSEDAVAGLLKRAVKRLRTQLTKGSQKPE